MMRAVEQLQTAARLRKIRQAARALRVVLLPATLLLSACATEYGHREINTAPSVGVETRPQEGLATIAPPIVPVPQVTPPAVLSRPQISLNAPKTIEESDASGAILKLYHQAQAARDTGHLDQAEGALTRALRIDPRNAFVWQLLSSVHLGQRQYDLAANEAEKSTSLARGNPYIEATNWRIVADVRDARGDAAGALDARAQADDLLNGLSLSQ